MKLPLNKSDFDVFLSHARKDHDFAAMLDRWLTGKAGHGRGGAAGHPHRIVRTHCRRIINAEP